MKENVNKIYKIEDALKDQKWQESNQDFKVIIGQNLDTNELVVESLFSDGGLSYPTGGDGNYLVASANTGNTGAMNFIRVILACLMHEHSPEEVKFIIANATNDFLDFEDSPYLFCPIIKDKDDLLEKYEWFGNEIEERTKVIYKDGLKEYKSFTDYNQKNGNKFPVIVFVDTLLDIAFADNIGETYLLLYPRRRATGYYYGLTKIISTHFSPYVSIYGSKKVVFNLTDLGMSKALLGDNSALSLKGKGDMIYSYESDKNLRQHIQAAFANDSFIATLAKGKNKD